MTITLFFANTAKPWLKKGKNIRYWRKYSVSVCNGKGRCILSEKTSGVCKCDEGYSGIYCEVKQSQTLVEWLHSFFHFE